MLLGCAYDGTYLTGIARQSSKIVLTLIGGGCFGNPIEYILNAIVNSHIKYSEKLSDDCEIILPLYMPDKKLLNTIKEQLSIYDYVHFDCIC
jgi:hypothetical protein